MTDGLTLFQYGFPPMVIAMATVLLCFYLCLREKREGCDLTIPTEVHTISLSENQAEADTHRFGSLNSTVDPPPPYSLFDPKLADARIDEPPPAYDMYPIMLPLTSHHWAQELEPPQPPSPPPLPPINHPNPQRSWSTSSSWT